MFAQLLLLIGLALSIGSWFIPGLNPLAHLVVSTIGSCMALVGFFACLIARYYRIATPNMAYVRTGSGGIHVVRDGGQLVFPIIHRTTEVSLELTQIKINRVDANALPTRDGQRLGFHAEFNIRVEPTPDAIYLVAQHFAGQCSRAGLAIEATMQNLVMATDSAIIRTGFEQFLSTLRDAVKQDLASHGILLESMNVSLI